MQTGIQLSLFGVLVALLGYRFRSVITDAMRDRLMRMFWHYSWGVFSAGLNGAALAVKGSLGVAAGAALTPQTVQPPNLDMLFCIFAVAFLLNGLDWFGKNPLPTTLETNPPISA